MIGPAIQAALFLSIIYWYSKGMLTLINDYYRDEFKSYIDKEGEKEVTQKTTGILADSEICPVTHIEGLPDVLKSINENKKSEGIVVRNIEKNPQCSPATTTDEEELESIDNNKLFIFSSKTSMESSNDPYTRSIKRTEDLPEKYHYKSKSILNPSQIGQSNYRQMANQQASDTADGKSTTRTSSSSLNRNSGNCFENDGTMAAVRLQRAPDKRSPAPTITTPSTSKMKSKVAPMPPTAPKIALNGVLMPTDLIRQRLEEKRPKESCQRKTVNEMVQYWTNYLEAVETKEQTSVVPGRKSSTGEVEGRRLQNRPRAKSSGEIHLRKRTLNLTPDS